ncbi:hypothetical protein [Sphingopyxis sp.]|uniref:hypothetical protein n=1 Tax=Sphingopyxis sp. TaxID=1908224 RepID=UPI002D78F0F9|nr:hypothetical protein [Sphingopyxis sp.]HET6523151.1 hypothetical protein [Sphingopyxis sp.]
MKTIQYTVRVPAAVDKAMQKLAAQQNVTPYEMLQRCVKAGVNAQLILPAADGGSHELVAEVASISTRLADVERMLDRTLFTACAAYCYARSAAMGGEKTDEVITAETNRAYDRQLAAMAERP